jgi:cell division protein FtsQ
MSFLPYRVLGALIAAAMLASIIYVFVSPTWYVEGAQVNGLRYLSSDEICAAAGIDGLSIFYVDPQQLAQKLEALPSVERAIVVCRLPAQVDIQIVERTPAAIWQSQGVQYWVDTSGKLFQRAADLAGLPIIVEQDATARAVGGQADKATLEAVLGLRRLLPEVTVFGFSRQGGLSFDLPSGQRVLASTSQEPARTAAALKTLTAYFQEQNIEPTVIDLRYGQRAFWH